MHGRSVCVCVCFFRYDHPLGFRSTAISAAPPAAPRCLARSTQDLPLPPPCTPIITSFPLCIPIRPHPKTVLAAAVKTAMKLDVQYREFPRVDGDAIAKARVNWLHTYLSDRQPLSLLVNFKPALVGTGRCIGGYGCNNYLSGLIARIPGICSGEHSPCGCRSDETKGTG